MITDLFAFLYIFKQYNFLYCLVTARERDRLEAVVPPVGDSIGAGRVAEGHHVVDLTPTVLTYPTTTACVIT